MWVALLIFSKNSTWTIFEGAKPWDACQSEGNGKGDLQPCMYVTVCMLQVTYRAELEPKAATSVELLRHSKDNSCRQVGEVRIRLD